MPQTQIRPRHAAAITAVLALLAVFPPLATDMYLPAIGEMARHMKASSSAAELSLSVFFLGLCVGQLVMGPLIDGYGRKGPLLAGAVLFTVVSAGLALVDDIRLFNTLRFFQALGACAGMVVGRAVVNDLHEGQRAAKTLTVLVMLMTIGPIIAPTLGSLVLETLGWRAIFGVLVAIGLVALLLSQQIIPETLPREKWAPRPFRDALDTTGMLLRQPAFVLPAVVTGLVQGGMFAFITGSSGVFQGVFGLSSLAYGGAFAGIAAALLVFGQINGKLLDHFVPAQILRAGLPVYALAGLVLVLISGTDNLWLFVVPLWLAIGMVGLLSANAMALAMAEARQGAGTGSALLGVVQFGLAFIVSSCVALGGSHTPLPMSLGILLPATMAALLWGIGRRAEWLVPQD